MQIPVALKKNSLVRKSIALAEQLPRAVTRWSSSKKDFLNLPPMLVNSFPKSGTHLLLQIVESLPNTKNYDSFIASTPSVTFRERSSSQHLKMISRIVPAEIVSSHLFYAPEYERALNEINCAHFFIYRDVRDIAISEAHYLTDMNKWHRLHPYFKRLPDLNARISQSILGIYEKDFPYDYPNIGERFKRYAGWIHAENVCAIKFEDLQGEKRRQTVEKMMEYYARHLPHKVDVNALVESALANIAPEKSHTFRKGEASQWKKVFTEEHNRQIESAAGDVLRQLGFM